MTKYAVTLGNRRGGDVVNTTVEAANMTEAIVAAEQKYPKLLASGIQELEENVYSVELCVIGGSSRSVNTIRATSDTEAEQIALSRYKNYRVVGVTRIG